MKYDYALSKIKRECTVRGFKIIAIAMRGNHAISSCVNKRADDGRVSDWTHHAEEGLVRKLLRCNSINRFRGKLTVLVLRVTAHGLALAKPCERCQLLLRAAGISKVQFSTNQGTIEEL